MPLGVARILSRRGQRERAANTVQPWAIRLLDIYAPDGNRTRITLEAVKVLKNGVPRSVLVRKVADLSFARMSYVNDEQAKEGVKAALLRYCLRHAVAGRLVDSPMRWHLQPRSPEFRNSLVYSTKLLPARYAWDASTRRWVPTPGMEAMRWDAPERLEELRRAAT